MCRLGQRGEAAAGASAMGHAVQQYVIPHLAAPQDVAVGRCRRSFALAQSARSGGSRFAAGGSPDDGLLACCL